MRSFETNLDSSLQTGLHRSALSGDCSGRPDQKTGTGICPRSGPAPPDTTSDQSLHDRYRALFKACKKLHGAVQRQIASEHSRGTKPADIPIAVRRALWKKAVAIRGGFSILGGEVFKPMPHRQSHKFEDPTSWKPRTTRHRVTCHGTTSEISHNPEKTRTWRPKEEGRKDHLCFSRSQTAVSTSRYVIWCWLPIRAAPCFPLWR